MPDLPGQFFPGYNWCGPGNLPRPPTSPQDNACRIHDLCYERGGLNHNNVGLPLPFGSKRPGQDPSSPAQDSCDDQLCSSSNGEYLSPFVRGVFCDPKPPSSTRISFEY